MGPKIEIKNLGLGFWHSKAHPQPIEHTELAPAKTEEIPWDKFRRYFAPLPGSINHFRPDQINFGDIYKTNRPSGKELTILPMQILGWRNKHDWVDLLLILGLNQANEVVGMRTLYTKIPGTDYVRGDGALASAVCNDGVGSALEQVRERTAQEILMQYQKKDHPLVTHLREKKDDDNIRVLEKLKKLASDDPNNNLMQERVEHAGEDRPRWITLFDAKPVREGETSDYIYVYPKPGLVRGFNSDHRTVYQMTRIPGSAGKRATWMYEELGTEMRAAYAERGLFNKEFLHEKMSLALIKAPETES